MRFTIFRNALLLLALASSPAAAEMDPSSIHEHMLDNGMKVLLWEDQTIPNLAIFTFWKVGSRNEAPGTTGMAHFFEHMMFNGSANYEPGEFDVTMEAAGGANNAYTSKNVTVYQDWVPSSALSITLDLERDRIGFLKVDPEVVDSERGVVYSERRRSLEDSNPGLMWEQLAAAAYTAHPYSWPIIGWRSDIENWRLEDLEDFFHTWYSPNNAIMVICGAFQEEELLAQLQEKIGSLPIRDTAREVVTREPKQRGERRVELRKEANLGAIYVGWHVPETAHPDLRALELLDLILTRGESSRLYQRLVDQDQIALDVSTDTDNNFNPGLFQIYVQNRDGIDGPTVEAALYEELDRIAEHGVDERELAKAKNMFLTGFYRSMATISGRANALGSFELFHGDWNKLFDITETYSALNSEDLQRVVHEYLTADNRTVVTLIPTADENTESKEAADAR